MTAYLQPGDRIILAVPFTGSVNEDGNYVDPLADALTAAYNRNGVVVEECVGHPELSYPVVVAVFRAEKGAP